MTSYSTHATNAIRFVDGDLPPDEELAEDYRERMVSCLAAGAARALLDSARDEGDPDQEIVAEQWHTPNEGWEVQALDDETREAVGNLARMLVTERFHDIKGLADELAYSPKYSGAAEGLWHHDFGMALYRVGGLLGYTLVGAGVGFYDYTTPWSDRLSEWRESHNLGGAFEVWIDGTEEPCLLHTSIHHEVQALLTGAGS